MKFLNRFFSSFYFLIVFSIACLWGSFYFFLFSKQRVIFDGQKKVTQKNNALQKKKKISPIVFHGLSMTENKKHDCDIVIEAKKSTFSCSLSNTVEGENLTCRIRKNKKDLVSFKSKQSVINLEERTIYMSDGVRSEFFNVTE